MPAKILVHNSTNGKIERDNNHRCSNLSHCSPSGSRPWVANIVLIEQFPPPPPPPPPPLPPPHHPPPTPTLLSQPPILSSTREKEEKFILEKTSTTPLMSPSVPHYHHYPPTNYYLLSELTRIHRRTFYICNTLSGLWLSLQQLYYRKSSRQMSNGSSVHLLKAQNPQYGIFWFEENILEEWPSV